MSLDIRQELGQNFIDYATAVNSDRSNPDAKSGLKPVARRILWDMFDKGYMNNLVSSYYSSKLYLYSNLSVVCGDIECYHVLLHYIFQ